MLSLLLSKKIVFASVLVTGLTVLFGLGGQASALSGSEFNASNIIDDSIFFNSTTMNEGDVQAFLNAKVPVCDTYGTQASGRGGTRAQWGQQNGYAPPYTCLKDYTQAVPGFSADAFCDNGMGGGTLSSAQIIARVSAACGINPQTMIVLLQKEQALITDDWPWSIQYRAATGYGCPDTAECDSAYYGFYNQVYNAARQYKRYVRQSNLFNFKAGVTSFVQYNPNAGCSGTNVAIGNQATAALYNFTPYQPNAAALANLYGTGDGCSAYGNRNFWRMFNDWFGTTSGDLVRTPGNATVYLISGTNKYPISNINVLNDFGRLGPLRLVADSYLNGYTTGPTLGHMVGDPGGTLYFVNAGIKLPFTSCSSVEDYGYGCSNIIYLDPAQLSKLASGPFVTSFVKSNTNATIYYMSAGKKRPIPGWGDLQSLQIPLSINVFNDSLITQIPTGAYVLSPGSLMRGVSSATVYIVKSATEALPISSFTFPQEYGLSTGVRVIGDADLPTYVPGSILQNKIKCNGNLYIATHGQSYPMPLARLTDYGLNQSDFYEGGQLCNYIPIMAQSFDKFIKVDNGTIYYVDNGQKKPFAGLGAYVSYGGNSSNTVWVSDYYASTIPTGATIFQ